MKSTNKPPTLLNVTQILLFRQYLGKKKQILVPLFHFLMATIGKIFFLVINMIDYFALVTATHYPFERTLSRT